ncbi:MAG: hypothetical protein C0608_06605 [Deltaproteobacteria bacterium]|nr:MAG: hypothetical protein C0608_06605 [Deltaproteobacteria bacterium]
MPGPGGQSYSGTHRIERVGKMPRQMFVNVKNEEESRIAILNDGLLEELSIDTSHDTLIEGNIYKGKIERVVPGLEAVFVDFGREKNGFLAFHEIHPDYYKSGERKADNLRRGQEVMVQVKKGEIGDKGAALTTYISIPGRYLVLMPLVAKRGVSKQIEDGKVRDKLRKAVDETAIPEGMGYIIRTAAELQTKQDIQRDVTYMLRLWKRVNDLSENSKAPAILYQESDIVIRTIRDYFTPDIKELLVDDALIYKRVKAFFSSVMPWNTSRVRYYEGNSPLFSKHNLEGQISSIHSEKVKLPSGGSIVIQRTEALVSVDVNSGAGPGANDIEKTATVTNIEAASEVARQLRLRDLGGLIVIDFIDMRSSANRTKVKKELVKSLKGDKARIDVGTISKFGLLEMSRQRLKSAQGTKLTSPCPICQGTGRLIATESFALSVLRVVQAVLAKGKGARSACVGVPVETATFLMNRKRQSLRELELKFGAPVSIFAETALLPNQYYAEFSLGERVRVETNLPSNFHLDRLSSKGTALRPEYQVKTEKEEAATASYTAINEDEDGGAKEEPEALKQEQKEQAAGDEATAPKKKRRRRPRRKKSSANVAEAASKSEGAEKVEEDADTKSAEADIKEATEEVKGPQPEADTPPQTKEEAQESGSTDDGAEQPKKRRPRRRGGRGRGRAKPASENADAAEVAAAAVETTQDSATKKQIEVESAIDASESKAPATSEAPAPSEPAPKVDAAQESPNAEPETKSEPEKKSAPKKRASRSRAKKKPAEEQPATAAKAEEKEAVEAGDKKVEEKSAPKKRATSRARKPAAKKPSAREIVDAIAAGPSLEETPPKDNKSDELKVVEQDKEVKKPARKRTPRKKKAETTEAEPQKVAEKAAKEEPSSAKEEKPKTPRRRRSTAAKKKADDAPPKEG